MRRPSMAVIVALALSLAFSGVLSRPASAAPFVDPELQSALAAGGEVKAVVVFTHPVGALEKTRLLAAGASLAIPYSAWPWAGVVGSASAIGAVAAMPDVAALWHAPDIDFYLHESVPLIGADRVWAPKAAGGLGVTGAGIGVAVVDTGIYGLHPDLRGRVVRNLKFVADQTIDTSDSDTTSGHGTHVAGTIAGDGTASKTGTSSDLGGRGYYTGVAPEANLIGLGVGDGRNIIWSLQAFNWIVENHRTYNIRVVSNSWGNAGGSAWNPDNPTSQAIETMIDLGIVVNFAAGNDGETAGHMLNRFCGPRVICVAAGTKSRGLASFSSTGVNDTRTPTISAPGQRICAARNPHGTTTGSTADAGLFADTPAVRPEWKALYTCISGTSMATPHASGVAALMLQSNPRLTPTQVRDVLTATADPMPGFTPAQVGAGYMNAFAAVKLAKKTKGTSTCVTKSGQAIPTVVTSETWTGSVGPGVADLGMASHDFHDFDVATSALAVTVEIRWTTPQDIDLKFYDPSGAEAGSSGELPGITVERATKRSASCDTFLPAGVWRSDAIGFATLQETYTGTVEVEYRTRR